MIKKKLQSEDGSSMVDIGAGVLVMCLLAVFIVNVITALIYRSEMGTLASNVCKIVSVEGKYDSSVRDKIEEYKKDSNLESVTVALDGTEFISGTEKVQLNEKIMVTVSGSIDISFFKFTGFKIDVQNKAMARSEVYWKS